MRKDPIAQVDYSFTLKYVKGERMLNVPIFASKVYIIKCESGEATILIDAQKYLFSQGENFILGETRMLKVIACSDDFAVTKYAFTIQFMNEVFSGLNNSVADSIYYHAPGMSKDEIHQTTDLILQQLSFIYASNWTYRHKLVKSCVLNYIYTIYDSIVKYSEASDTSSVLTHLVDTFFRLCLEFHTSEKNVDFYAEKMNISTSYLHKIIKTSYSMTPKQVIDYYIAGSAKKMLLTTNLSNQQIADRLNFPDQATFGQFFKRNVGIPPSKFRSVYK